MHPTVVKQECQPPPRQGRITINKLLQKTTRRPILQKVHNRPQMREISRSITTPGPLRNGL
jgi:hypothetical protein